MKYYKSFFVLIAPLFLSGAIKENKKSFPVINDHSKAIGLSAYEVRFNFAGEVYPYGDTSSVPSRKRGTVSLIGTLEGNENGTADEDITYTGILHLSINMEFWAAQKTGDGDDWCTIKVSGYGPVKTELQIYYDHRGGYIHFTDTTSEGFTRTVTGSCDSTLKEGEREIVPLTSISSIFNAQELPLLSGFRKLGDLKLNQEYEDAGKTGTVIIKVLKKIR
ncbi:MAG: hypothetical protein HYR66_06540 [Sphingobacteriales bacterium]|nr:hypothetical protein [Sphingobacteriales bacterium]MBI3718311.1 hypothetical protein [Sphingobacteriales bacterium]